MVDGVKVENDADIAHRRAQKEPKDTAFIVNTEFLLLKEEKKKDDDNRNGVAEKDLLHERELACKVDEEIHQRKAQRLN